ncbi:hypothetical protein [Fredinandcohnia quinoae]|uniref:UPF0738 protein MJG50_12915 n=1 Tax=Fredinandcohnia quinoae TaxID=2918902 RepID=A0AAW5E007_9BACI|nr:hypothetical protein [Fredinandcohnia sp. SECRCQ15]MCH1626235.1 hypothetical protein [Fredinandcohnia sp. SECRCQ15]
MQKHIEINNFQLLNDKLMLEGNCSNISTDSLKASGQMLVDSDSYAFIYKLENEQEYIYVRLTIELWTALKNVINNRLPVVLQLNGLKIELENIIEELTYLISNIEGNANYGEEMVAKVEEAFL